MAVCGLDYVTNTLAPKGVKITNLSAGNPGLNSACDGTDSLHTAICTMVMVPVWLLTNSAFRVDTKPEAVVGAHQKDLEVQAKHRVKCLNYWYDEGAVFCCCLRPRAKKRLTPCTGKLRIVTLIGASSLAGSPFGGCAEF